MVLPPRADAWDEILSAEMVWGPLIKMEAHWVSMFLVIKATSSDRFTHTNYFSFRGNQLYGPNPRSVKHTRAQFEAARAMQEIVEKEHVEVTALVLRAAWGDKPRWRKDK